MNITSTQLKKLVHNKFVIVSLLVALVILSNLAIYMYLKNLTDASKDKLVNCAKTACTSQVDQLKRAVIAEDSSATLRTFDYIQKKHAFDGTSDRLVVEVVSHQGEALADKIAELAWRSEVEPLSIVEVSVYSDPNQTSKDVSPLYPKSYSFIIFKNNAKRGILHPFVERYGQRKPGQLQSY